MAEAKTMAEMEGAISGGWGGGALPYAISHKKLGMWLFIISDSLTFSAMLIGYSYVRVSNPNWPTPFQFSPSIIGASIMTFCLLSSSLTMVMAVAASERRDTRWTVRWIMATMLGGIAFIVLHANEWRSLIVHEHVYLMRNHFMVNGVPATPLFGATFFSLTGLHMVHVTSGVIYLGLVAWGRSKGKFSHDDVEISGLYWHFVDLVWMFIFPLVYLLSVSRTAVH